MTNIGTDQTKAERNAQKAAARRYELAALKDGGSGTAAAGIACAACGSLVFETEKGDRLFETTALDALPCDCPNGAGQKTADARSTKETRGRAPQTKKMKLRELVGEAGPDGKTRPQSHREMPKFPRRLIQPLGAVKLSGAVGVTVLILGSDDPVELDADGDIDMGELDIEGMAVMPIASAVALATELQRTAEMGYKLETGQDPATA